MKNTVDQKISSHSGTGHRWVITSSGSSEQKATSR
jgi:hypothetical protein